MMSLLRFRSVGLNALQYSTLSAKKAATQAPQVSSLTWTQFFQLRVSKKRYERIGGVLGGTMGLCSGTYYFFFVAQFDPTQPLLGLPDPTAAYFLGALATAGISTALGIFAMGAVWRLGKATNVLRQLDLKEKEFFTRLSAHRPRELRLLTVPGRGEVTLPDYYGEKVNSIWDYKKWVQKQV